MATEKAYEEWEAKCVKLILLKEGTYELEEQLLIECPISVHGAGQDKTILQGEGVSLSLNLFVALKRPDRCGIILYNKVQVMRARMKVKMKKKTIKTMTKTKKKYTHIVTVASACKCHSHVESTRFDTSPVVDDWF